MSSTKLLCVSILLVSFGALTACGDDDDGGDPAASCEQFCEKAAPLNCANTPAATCVADCKAEAAQVPAKCRSVAAKAASCIAQRPTSDLECDDFGEAVNKDGVCEQEATAAIACFLQ
jgi:hypothetical protein